MAIGAPRGRAARVRRYAGGWVRVLLAGLMVAAPLGGRGASPKPYVSVNNLVVPFYAAGQSEAVAVLRVEHVFRDHERRGFFRIGLLPLLVGEGVRLEFRDAGVAARELDRVRQGVESSLGGDRIEMRRVRMSCGGTPARVLSATRLRTEKDGRWRLLEGVSVQIGETRRSVSNAVLQVSGPRAGRLTLETAEGSAELNLLGDPAPQSP